MSQQQIVLKYTDNTALGYGRLGHYIHRELEKLGVEVSTEFGHDPDEPQPEVFLGVCLPTQFNRWVEGQFRVLFTMWEGDRLPVEWIEGIQNADMVIVPSKQNASLFRQYHDNVHVINLGIDPNIWVPTERDMDQTFFNFLASGYVPGKNQRKGLDIVEQAFFKAFPDINSLTPQPHLVLKTKQPWDNISSHITCFDQVMSAEEEVEMYEEAHCFVGVTRGEGFGLQPLQAMAQGCPTILSLGHGHDEYAEFAWDAITPYGMIPAEQTSVGWAEGMQYWDYSIDELAGKLRKIYTQYDKARLHAREFAPTISQFWSWGSCVQELKLTILPTRLFSTVSGPVIKPEEQLYEVAVTEQFVADIAGVPYDLRPGKRYALPLYIKRLLFDRGILDADVYEVEKGLLPRQAEALDDYRQFCSHCNQAIGSGVSKFDLDDPPLDDPSLETV